MREDHVAYIASWLTVLRNDKRSVFTAAGRAQRPADFLCALQPSAAARRLKRGLPQRQPFPYPRIDGDRVKGVDRRGARLGVELRASAGAVAPRLLV